MAINAQELESAVRDFSTRLVAAVEAQTRNRIQSIVSAVLEGSTVRTPRRPSPAPAPTETKPRKTKPRRSTKRSRKSSAKRLAELRLQGQYLGALRGLGPEARASVKKAAIESGVAAAIKLALSLK